MAGVSRVAYDIDFRLVGHRQVAVHDNAPNAILRWLYRRFFARIRKPAGKPDMTSLTGGLVDYYRFDDLTASSAVTGAKGELTADPNFGRPKLVEGKLGKTIKLNGDHTFQKCGIADLNGDGHDDLVTGNFAYDALMLAMAMRSS